MARRPERARGTPALKVLAEAGVEHEVAEFDAGGTVPGRGYGLAAARALGLDPTTVHKTLMVMVDDRLWCAVTPVSGDLDLKAMARAAGGKRAALAAPAAAERATGYTLGGVSPFGQRRRSPTVVDSSALRQDRMMVSAGARGLEVAVSPADLVRLTDATVAPIARDPRG